MNSHYKTRRSRDHLIFITRIPISRKMAFKRKLTLADNTDGSVQDCGNSSANALELPQSCTKPSIQLDRYWSMPLRVTWNHFWHMVYLQDIIINSICRNIYIHKVQLRHALFTSTHKKSHPVVDDSHFIQDSKVEKQICSPTSHINAT